MYPTEGEGVQIVFVAIPLVFCVSLGVVMLLSCVYARFLRN